MPNGAELRESEKPHKTFAIPLTHSQAFDALAARGFKSEAQLATVPGVRAIDQPFVLPGPEPSVYAFPRETVHRNLYPRSDTLRGVARKTTPTSPS
jgi:hypothetical protein